MNKKYIIILSIILIIWVIISFWLKNKEKEKNIIWDIVSKDKWDKNNILLDNNIDKNKIKALTIDTNKIKSIIRVICWIWNIQDVLWSSSFKILKKQIDGIKEKQINKTEFIYITLPWIVYDSCKNIDDTFLSKIIKYLQSDSIKTLEKDSFNLKKYKNFLQNIKYISSNINKNKIKNDPQYLDEILFTINLESIKSAYFSEYMYRWNDPKIFFYTNSILSLTETNNILEKTLSDFQDFLKKIWIKNISQLRLLLLKNNLYKNIDDLKNDLLKNYNELDLILKNKNIVLSSHLLNVWNLYKFYINEYKTLIKDKQIQALFNDIWKKYLLFSIINDDYADWLEEDWSWKEFFWDSIKWNWIIKIGYIYLINSSK